MSHRKWRQDSKLVQKAKMGTHLRGHLVAKTTQPDHPEDHPFPPAYFACTVVKKEGVNA
jgi:hypothetical protein